MLALSRQSGYLAAGVAGAYWLWSQQQQQPAECWVYRDDIGGQRGIKGYEEQAVLDKFHWPFQRYFGSYNAATLRRGFRVFARSCNTCHSMMFNRYDFLIKKAFRQKELGAIVEELAPVSPGHWYCKGYFRQEWLDRPKKISDFIFSPYISQDHAKTANGGLYPSDLSRIAIARPGGPAYIYNILTGYGFEPPYGIDVPEGRHFNPYFEHMIIGMPRQLYDGMIEYPDGTPASAPQMAYDVSEFCHFMAAKDGLEYRMAWTKLLLIFLTVLPFSLFRVKHAKASILGARIELYNVSDGYKKAKYYSRFYKMKRHFGFARQHPRNYFIGK
jgi:ubiquinol-cytochrome c reductase cytochrome c1 subunit